MPQSANANIVFHRAAISLAAVPLEGSHNQSRHSKNTKISTWLATTKAIDIWIQAPRAATKAYANHHFIRSCRRAVSQQYVANNVNISIPE